MFPKFVLSADHSSNNSGDDDEKTIHSIAGVIAGWLRN